MLGQHGWLSMLQHAPLTQRIHTYNFNTNKQGRQTSLCRLGWMIGRLEARRQVLLYLFLIVIRTTACENQNFLNVSSYSVSRFHKV